MSLILEALKKSEAERQLGRAPGLMSPMVRVSKRRGISPWWGVLALALVVLAGAAWWVNREERAASTVRAEPVEPPLANEPVSSPAEQVDSPVRGEPVEPPLHPPAVAPGPAAPLPADPDFVSVERESLPVAAQPTTVPPPQEPEPLPPADGVVAAPPPTKPATIPPITLPPPVAPTEAPLPTVDATPPSAQPAPSAETPLESLPTLAELMPDVRAALPTLKLSMHVYSTEPAGRFVLIDGKRLVQGDAITPSLTLAEIRRDGAVLDFGGKRFVVPRP